jgi:transcriptional regulator with XRE-family HTH domain
MTLKFHSLKEICQQLATRCKTLRLTLNVGQRELAARAGVSFGTVRRFERGESINLENFVRILEALGRADEMLKILEHDTSLSIARREQLESAKRRRRATPKKS